MALVKNDAAIYVSDSDAKEKLVATAVATVANEEKLASLADNISKMAKPKAAEEIAEEVILLAEAYSEKEIRRKKENLK